MREEEFNPSDKIESHLTSGCSAYSNKLAFRGSTRGGSEKYRQSQRWVPRIHRESDKNSGYLEPKAVPGLKVSKSES